MTLIGNRKESFSMKSGILDTRLDQIKPIYVENICPISVFLFQELQDLKNGVMVHRKYRVV